MLDFLNYVVVVVVRNISFFQLASGLPQLCTVTQKNQYQKNSAKKKFAFSELSVHCPITAAMHIKGLYAVMRKPTTLD